MKISIIGAGNGGQAMAGHFSLLGHEVCLFDRNQSKVDALNSRGIIELSGEIKDTVKISIITSDIKTAIEFSSVVMITVTADAHRSVAEMIAPYVLDNQIFVLNPGRTLGALEFSTCIRSRIDKKVYVAECQSLIYACRKIREGEVNIIGIKNHVLMSACPSIDTDLVLNTINQIFPCFEAVENTLVTGLENFGAILHPTIILFNAATIERGQSFYFYNDITPHIAFFLEQIDNERLMLGKAFGLNLHSISDWISFAYNGISGENLCEKIKNNKAYYKIMAPDKLECRMLTEDIPTGILPMVELGKICGLELPLLNSMLELSQKLLDKDFVANGRTMGNLGLGKLDKENLLKLL